MAFFDELKKTARKLAHVGMEKSVELAQTGAAKSRELAEIAKLKASNLAEQDTIRKAYLELGRIYYAEKGATPDAAYSSACGRIAAAQEAIRSNNARIADIKNSDDDEVGAAAREAIVPESGDLSADIAPEENAPAGE